MEVVSSPDTHDVTIIAVHIQRLLFTSCWSDEGAWAGWPYKIYD